MISIKDLQGNVEPILDYKDLEIIEEVNEDFSLTMTVLNTDNNSHSFPLIKEESIIEYEGHEFRIKGLKRTRYLTLVTARHIFFDPIQVYGIAGGSTVNELLSFILKNTGWTYEIKGTIPNKLFANVGENTVVSLIRSACELLDCEVKIQPNKHLIFSKEIGSDNDFQFRYKHNIKTIFENINTDNLRTVIKGYGIGIEVTYKSPNVSIFGEIHADPFKTDEVSDSSALTDILKNQLIDYPEVSIEIEEVDLGEDKGLGDKVWVIYEPLNIEFQSRVMVKKTYPDQKGKNTVTLGNRKKTIADHLVETSVEIDENYKETRSKFEQTNENITLHVERLDGEISEAFADITVNADKISLVVSEDNKILAETIASEISLTPAAIGIMSRSIDLTGRVSFSSFDNSTKASLDNTNSTANAAWTTANNASNAAFEALSTIDDITTYNPYSGSTVIDGGKIYTDSLSSISANLGNVTVGILSSTDSKSRFSLAAGNMQVANSAGEYVIVNPNGITGYNVYGSTIFGINSRVAYSAALSTSNYNVYLGCKGEARVVDYDDTQIGRDGDPSSYTYRNLRAATIYSNGSPVATQSWVKDQGFATSNGNSDYATESWVRGLGYITGNSAYNTFLQIGHMDFGYDSTGKYISAPAIYSRQYGDIAHVGITSSGTLGRITSATKYKTAIELINEENAPKILNLNPKSWYDKQAVETTAKQLRKVSPTDENGIEKLVESLENESDIPYLRRINGLIAEDLLEAGLEDFVIYGEADENGVSEPEGIMYDRLWTMLIPIVRDQQARIEYLESK